jgi:hypothetical protein
MHFYYMMELNYPLDFLYDKFKVSFCIYFDFKAINTNYLLLNFQLFFKRPPAMKKAWQSTK